MNRYPLWKYLMIAATLVIGLLYSIPNFFHPDYAVQLVPKTAQILLDPAAMQQFDTVLKAQGLAATASENDGKLSVLRFSDDTTQGKAYKALKEAVGENYVVSLNLAATTPSWLRAINASPMTLGLDLRGGVHFLMEVDMKAAVDKQLNRYDDEFRDLMRSKNIKYQGIERQGDTLLVKFPDAPSRDAADQIMREEYSTALQFTPVVASTNIQVSIAQTELLTIQKSALQQNITTLRRRINTLGVAEPVIQQQGMNRIVVQLPGVQDTAEAKRALGATSTLEFRLVDMENDPTVAKQSGKVPASSQLYQSRDGRDVLLKRKVMLTGEFIVNAMSGRDNQNGQPIVSITLNSAGAKRFSKVTGENVKKDMAVVLISNVSETQEIDGKTVLKTNQVEEVISVATIQEQLSKNFQISGLDSPQEAHELAMGLRDGALAAPVYIVEERTVGPSMGQENIEKGFNSNFWGFVAVVAFMLVYYRMFGVISSLALAVNGLFLFALLSIIGATLTLPGLAGIALTLGMAIDANVLINERIREELRAGAPPQQAIFAGYDRAWGTILDSNLTTLIAGIALFMLGSGPIKGFAVVLCLGILTSMFSAVTVSRAMVNLMYGSKSRLEKIAI
ncbi:protein translocase subunit SecD [Thiothrix fructosivorans]|jgi:preprotein translocase subunit SecD|uniref:Protein translocase subunit SecD n=1 Tax=Thiothrix fructosivorans TaxID=111770 RepID=A0A8B0SIU4_9GAMM|nr:protein translocase subunit SecD [Thiothrix fructosivorans]MBO0611607.1 protein translocase subunit SecD [Thiothrix fructosivorans]QTX10729.1 protein translocase subunit SecD [Thiothrix fructosivorans]